MPSPPAFRIPPRPVSDLGFFRIPVGVHRIPVGVHRIPVGMHRVPGFGCSDTA